MTQGLTASRLIAAWELGLGRLPLDRAIALLWCAGQTGDLATLPLAERDGQLLALRQATFGDRLSAVTACPDCGAELELELEVSALTEALAAVARGAQGRGPGPALRALNSRDLAAAAAVPEDEVPALLRKRLTGRKRDLPTIEHVRIDKLIEQQAAASELEISLTCGDCATRWSETLDVAAHLWAEIEGAARRVMAEVAEIAAAFGWSEREILALSEARRSAYLSLARGG